MVDEAIIDSEYFFVNSSYPGDPCMPSPLVIPVATISQIKPHSNADSLEIAEVLGWQCVVQKDRYHAGDKVIYIAPDALLDKELSDAWGVTPYLDRGRVRSVRLRGEPSF